MEASKLTLAVVSALACSSSRAPVVTAPPAAPDAAAVDVAPAVDPCAQGPLRDALGALGSDHVLADTSMGDLRRPHDRVTELAGRFPLLTRNGNKVLAVANTEVLPGAVVALVVPDGRADDPGWQVTGPSLAVLTCRAGEGYTFAARPFALGTESRMQLLSVRPTVLPGGARGATATVAAYLANGDWHATAYLLGVSTDDLPVRLPRAATVGVVAVVGAVGERVFEEGAHEPRSIEPLDATGWYPTARDEEVFVRVARERIPTQAPGRTDAVRVVQLARLGRHGFTSALGGVDNGLWFLAGTLGEPDWCGRDGVRCGRLTVDGDVVTDGTFGFAWIAGAWPVTGEAPRSVTAPGARWMYVGQWEGAGPPRDPTRQAPLTELRVQTVPATPAAPAPR